MLLDSGSQITCISETFFKYLNEIAKMSVFPVSNVMVSPAFGKK